MKKRREEETVSVHLTHKSLICLWCTHLFTSLINFSLKRHSYQNSLLWGVTRTDLQVYLWVPLPCHRCIYFLSVVLCWNDSLEKQQSSKYRPAPNGSLTLLFYLVNEGVSVETRLVLFLSKPNYYVKVIYFPIITPLKHPILKGLEPLSPSLSALSFYSPWTYSPIKSCCSLPVIIAQYIYIE